MIHVDDLGNLLFNIISNKFENSLSDEETNFSKFMHATDCSNLALRDMFPHLQFQPVERIVEEIVVTNSLHIHHWNSNIFFKQCLFEGLSLSSTHSTFEMGLSRRFPEVWNEFLRANHLTPVRIAVVGGPKAGKSSVSQFLSEK